MLKNRKTAAVWLVILTMLFVTENPAAASANSQTFRNFYAGKFYRTELYFGMNKGDDTVVSEEDWNKFLAEVITPRFPAGLTVFEAHGQYKDSSGKIVREPSRVVAIFYPKKEREAVNRKIEEIRAAYKRQFAQESVMRIDFKKTFKVTF